jgi:hypothetical protein
VCDWETEKGGESPHWAAEPTKKKKINFKTFTWRILKLITHLELNRNYRVINSNSYSVMDA